MTRTPALAAALALATGLAVGLSAPSAVAQDVETLSGDEITALVSGNTVQGSMTESGGYSEFYAEDGTIRAEDYTGQWSIQGDAMCFAYGGEPECFDVGGDAAEVLWIQDGELLGSGMVVEGNPNDF